MKHFIKKITLFLLFLVSFTFISADNRFVFAETTDFYEKNITVNTINNDENLVAPCADIIEWKYVIISGVTYRRQYNVTKGEWIGVWEIAP